jgi:multiple sugar transport system permease protein
MTTTTITRAAPRSADLESPARTSRSEHNRAGWLFAAPFLVLYVLFLLGPVLIGLVVSFFNTATVSPGLGKWVGVDNYADVLGSGDFWASMWHSTLFTLLTTPLLVLLPLLFAMFAARISRNQWFFRLAFFAPYVVPSSIVCLIFAFMYTPETGLISHAFGWLGLTAPDFLGSVSGAWFSVVLLTLWWTFGFNFILYTAALQDIPEELYEAAAIDGASPLQQMRRLTMPLLRPTISLVLLLQVLASLKVFDQIYLLLQGGPDKATRPAIEYIYDTGFTSYRGGYAAAATMVYFLVLVLVAAGWALARRGWRAREVQA